MPPDPDRLALLRAIAAAPDDDTPRLVYADWLDERGPADADRARAEFIRVACKGKAKARFAPAEGKWLDAHWGRLLPTVAARLAGGRANYSPAVPARSGRYLTLYTDFAEGTEEAPDGTLYVRLEVWRGFVRRAVYGRGFGLIAGALAADEPLARHEGEWGPVPARGPDGRPGCEIDLHQCAGSPVVWERVAGADRVDTDHRAKWFGEGADGWDALAARVRNAVAAAMTAEARHRAGWPEDFPPLGG